MHFRKFVINLETRPDRRAEMERQLASVGCEAEFVKAVRAPDKGTFPSIGARGCFLSHLETLRRGETRDGHVLIIEDDLYFIPEFSGIWDGVYRDLQSKNWSIFYPGHTLTDRPDGLSVIETAAHIICAHFIMINRAAISTIVQGLETILSRPPGHPLGGPMHVDGAYSTIRQQNPNLNTYIFSPSLGRQRPSRSDIADLKLYDRIKTARPLMRKLRELKGNLRM
jgi:glycosyl transferase, family 25